MKKFLLLACMLAVSLAAMAAFDVTKAPNVVPLVPPQAVASNATNTVSFAVRGLKGVSAVVVSANSVAGRALDVTLYTTNAAAGGWTPYVAERIAETNAFTRLVSFPADGLTYELKLDVGSIGAGSNVSAFLLSY